jgi:NAD(P)-dependent dehydrogenase (short-subunit alcohol dehydrogenase family)
MDDMTLKDRGIVITGASQGFGKAVAEACVREGAHVLICARDEELLNQTRAELAAKATSAQQVLAQRADVSSLDDVHALIGTASRSLPGFNGLVNNAGVHGPKGLLDDVDVLEWWKAVEINLLGTMLTCREALPVFRRRGYGKIVNLSGGGATSPMPRVSAYAASKAAIVRLTETIAHETVGAGIDVNAVAPGAMNTRLLDDILDQGPERVGAAFFERAVRQKEKGGAPLDVSANLCVYLLSRASDGITGRLISAVWDPWQNLTKHRDEIRESDIYTLRRIIPEDRDLKWE